MLVTRTCAPLPTACSRPPEWSTWTKGFLLIMNPQGIEHRRIVRAIVDDAKRAFYTGAIAVNWATDENYQWDLPGGDGRFYIPDIAFIHPDATTAEEERAAIALVVEVTSPTSPD